MQALSVTQQQVKIALGLGNPLVLSAMAEIFDRDPRFSLVTTSSSAEGFLGAVMRVSVEVGVVDWALPALGGQRLAEVLREQAQAPRIVIYGESAQGDLPRLAMVAGAAAFVGQNDPVERLLDVCLAAAKGQMVFPFLDIRGLQSDPMQQLTRRERGLLEGLAKGQTNRELAQELAISENTVKFHLSNLFEKLGVNNRTKAIARYYTTKGAAGGG